MNTRTFLKYSLLIGILLLFTNCVKNDDYKIPETEINELNILVNSSIEAVKNAWIQNYNANEESIYTFDVTTDGLFFEGVVVSSDFSGNFYKKLIVQNAFENANHGIEILINKTSLFESFEIGRKVFVKLDGLNVSYDDGVNNDPTDANPGRYIIGIEKQSRVDDIPTSLYLDHVIRSSEIGEVIPNVISVMAFSEKYINTLIQIKDIQFEVSQLGKTFAGEASDEFDGFRKLISCTDQSKVPLQTSSYSDFKSYVISEGSGFINAILTKDFTSSYFVLVANAPNNIDFSNPQRCDPILLSCEPNSVTSSEVVFNENFDTTSNSKLASAGWTNENVSGGSEKFELKKSSGNGYMQVAAYNTDENPMEVWLVSPAINLDNSENEVLTFKTRAGFYQGDALSAYVSTNYSGDVKTATWTLVPAELVDGPPSGYGGTFMSSGSINISCLEDNVFVGFRYLGADGVITTTFQIDTFRVTGNLD
jgi:hypothetical protein